MYLEMGFLKEDQGGLTEAVTLPRYFEAVRSTLCTMINCSSDCCIEHLQQYTYLYNSKLEALEMLLPGSPGNVAAGKPWKCCCRDVWNSYRGYYKAGTPHARVISFAIGNTN